MRSRKGCIVHRTSKIEGPEESLGPVSRPTTARRHSTKQGAAQMPESSCQSPSRAIAHRGRGHRCTTKPISTLVAALEKGEIGRASCRERAEGKGGQR